MKQIRSYIGIDSCDTAGQVESVISDVLGFHCIHLYVQYARYVKRADTMRLKIILHGDHHKSLILLRDPETGTSSRMPEDLQNPIWE